MKCRGGRLVRNEEVERKKAVDGKTGWRNRIRKKDSEKVMNEKHRGKL